MSPLPEEIISGFADTLSAGAVQLLLAVTVQQLYH
jgi:hypothetical protein